MRGSERSWESKEVPPSEFVTLHPCVDGYRLLPPACWRPCPLPLAVFGAAFMMDSFGGIGCDLMKGIAQPTLLSSVRKEMFMMSSPFIGTCRCCPCSRCFTSHCCLHQSLGTSFCQGGSQDFLWDHGLLRAAQEMSGLQNFCFYCNSAPFLHLGQLPCEMLPPPQPTPTLWSFHLVCK